jgi:hypothetical protein
LLQVNILRRSSIDYKTSSYNDTTKLTEEVKLYWTIQIATAGILGYIGTNITAVDSKSFLISFVAFLLISIGAICNFASNYYVHVEGERLGFSEKQENTITPYLAKIYSIISGIIGSVCLLSLLQIINHFFAINCVNNQVLFGIFGFALGFCINWLITRSVFKQLYSKGSKDYKVYSNASRKWFLIKTED